MNRPSGPRPTTHGLPSRSGYLTSPATWTMSSEEDKTPQGFIIPSFRSNAWQNSIWANTSLVGSFAKGKIDALGSRVADDDEYRGPSGSGAQAASSKALIWGQPWSVDKTSSIVLTAGSASIGHGTVLGNTNSPGKSILDPASGPFKYSSFLRPTDSVGHSLENYGVDPTWRSNSSASKDNSGLPSRQSESSSSVAANGSFFGSGQYPTIGHTPNNLWQMQRPPTQGRVSSFPSSDSQNSYMESSLEQQYLSPSEYAHYNSPQAQPGHSSIWATSVNPSSRNLAGYFSITSADSASAEQLAPGKAFRFNNRRAASLGGSYRRQPTSPGYYHTNETSPADHPPLRGSQPQSVPEIDRGLPMHQFARQQQYLPQHLIFDGQFQVQYPFSIYEYLQHNLLINTQQHEYQMAAPTYTSILPVPRDPVRDQKFGGYILRSQLLEEFLEEFQVSSKLNRWYELKDIYKHVVEFSGDQHGSRFIQQKLETANSDEKDQIFREIHPKALQLMTDVFGNYVIQKFFEHGNQLQKRMLAKCMKTHVNELSVQMYGCRVVQKALEHVLVDQQAELVRELQDDVLKYIKDRNGNYVIQKAIERVPMQHIQFVINAFKGHVHTLATHSYGCRVIQRILEYCSEEDRVAILEEAHVCASMLITDQYGNYVMQHVIEHGKPEDRAKIIRIVTSQLLALSKHKFASNVIEKTIQFGSDEQRRAIVAELTASDESNPLQLMMKDQFGNYVIKKLLAHLKGAERERFVEEMRLQLIALRNYNYGKQITAIEKLISVGSQTSPSSYNDSINTGPRSYVVPEILQPRLQ